MHLDLKTIFLSYLLSNCAITLVILPLWLSHRKQYCGMHLWVIDFLLQMMGNAFFVLYGQIPDALSILLRNTVIILGNMLLIIGLLKFYTIRPVYKFHLILLSVYILSITYFTLMEDSVTIRALLFCSVLGIQMTQIVILIHFRININFRNVAWPISATAAFSVILLIVRMTLTILHPMHGDFFDSAQIFVGYWLLAMQIISILLIISLFYAVTSRLALELRNNQEKLEQRVEERTQQLIESEKLAVIGRLAGGIAHEVNNPNQVIALNLPHVRRGIQALQSVADPIRYAKQSIGTISLHDYLHELLSAFDDMTTASDRIGRIAHDLKQHVSPEEKKCIVDINEVVTTSFNLTRKYREKHTSKTGCLIAKQQLFVKGYTHRLEQVIINILNNAAESLPDCSKAIHVETLYCDGNAIVRISDEGKGICPQDLPQITTPFYTTRRQEGGTGLGLWVALQIIKDHGGEIRFQSTTGNGTVVSIELPIYKENES
jgi:signal transduction histidine kinase